MRFPALSCTLVIAGALTGCTSPAAPSSSASSPPAPPAPLVSPAAATPSQTTAAGVIVGAPERAAQNPLPADPHAFAIEVARRHALPLAQVQEALAQARHNPSVVRLMTPSSAPPGTRKRSWPAYRGRFVEPTRIRHGLEFWDQHAATLAEAERRYGVPASIIVAVIGVETAYGRNMGNFRVLDALYTLSFSYPGTGSRDRSAYFRSELAQFLAASLRNGIAPTQPLGSYAGAVGMPQFMPSSIRDFGVSPVGRALPDLAGDPRDAIHSVANYLREHGWLASQPVFAPVVVPPQAAALVDGGLAPRTRWSEVQAYGVRDALSSRAGIVAGGTTRHQDHSWRDLPLGVINLPDDNGGSVEYRLGTPNFFAITHYNRSYFYASAVADLAAELASRKQGRR